MTELLCALLLLVRLQPMRNTGAVSPLTPVLSVVAAWA